MQKRLVTAMTVCVTLVLAGLVMAEMETKYATGTTSATITFGPARGRQVVKNLIASTDKLNGGVTIYSRPTTYAKCPVLTAPAGSATHIHLTNTGTAIGNSAKVVYWHVNGTAEYRTTAGSGNSATNITLSSGLTYAGTTSDYVYLVTQSGYALVGHIGTATGTNDTMTATDCFASPGDSPIVMILDGTTSSKIMATVDK